MSNFSRSALGGLLFAFWLMCFIFPYSLFMAYLDNTAIATMLWQMFVDFFVLWFICGAIAHCINGMFDDLNNRPRRDDIDEPRHDNKGTQSNAEQSNADKKSNDKSAAENKTDNSSGDSDQKK